MPLRLIRVRRRLWTLQAALLLCSVYLISVIYKPFGALVGLDFKPSVGSSTLESRSRPNSVSTTFQRISITGFSNLGVPGDFNCSDVAVVNELSVTPAIDIDDDLLEIASSIRHPLVSYASQGEGFSFLELVDRTWDRMSGSSVWLEDLHVFITVSRVFFYDKGVRRWSIISFLRAQIHDSAWNHIPGYKLNWHGQDFVFPRTFEVPIPFKPGGCFTGPEDPRIILETGVVGAEPVVVFNMQQDPYTLSRSMYVFRPFSNSTVRLVLDPAEHAEKNWAPFFMTHEASLDGKRRPSRWLHFVYQFHPLIIVRCHLLSGACSHVFQQDIPESFRSKFNYHEYTINGGSNFEPLDISSRPGITSFVGFPRTHIDEGCLEEAMYRPELTILSTNGTHFWLDYSSESLTFGNAILNEAELNDPCVSGRILLVNSIAYFDATRDGDEMTVSLSVNDANVVVASIRGVRHLFESLPQYDPSKWFVHQVPESLSVSHRISGCSVESAISYALEYTTPEMLEQERKRKEQTSS